MGRTVFPNYGEALLRPFFSIWPYQYSRYADCTVTPGNEARQWWMGVYYGNASLKPAGVPSLSQDFGALCSGNPKTPACFGGDPYPLNSVVRNGVRSKTSPASLRCDRVGLCTLRYQSQPCHLPQCSSSCVPIQR